MLLDLSGFRQQAVAPVLWAHLPACVGCLQGHPKAPSGQPWGSPAQPPAIFQLKAVHEQLAALSQAPVNKPKRKKEKKEKEKH